jgi:hypothetical protein
MVEPQSSKLMTPVRSWSSPPRWRYSRHPDHERHGAHLVSLGMGPDDEATANWYGVRLVFRVLNYNETMYEERITIWRANSIQEAIQLAEVEAEDYADPELKMFEYTGLAQAFKTFIPDRAPESGDEIFSLVRGSDLDTAEYLDHFFDSGTERQGGISLQ